MTEPTAYQKALAEWDSFSGYLTVAVNCLFLIGWLIGRMALVVFGAKP